MPSSQKFKISLRRNKDTPNPPSNGRYDFDDISATSNSRRGKAQKVLGGDQASGRLNGKPSLVSITVSELGQRSSSLRSAERPPLQPRPSSPLLGDRFVHSTAPSTADRSLHRHESSSTLRSYYDSQNSPPHVSQQTSESAARDYALRRGHYPRGGPYAPSTLSATTMGYGDNESSASSTKRRHVDFSFLHRSKNASKSSLQTSTTLLSPISTTSANKGPTSPRSDQGNRLTKSPRAKDFPQSQRLQIPNTRPDPLLAKVNVRKPKPGIQNWFDGCLEDLSEEEEEAEEETRQQQKEETQRPSSATKKPIDPRFPTSREGRKAMASRTSSRGSAMTSQTIPMVLDMRSHKPSNFGLHPPERRDFAQGNRPPPLKDVGQQNRPPSTRSKNSQNNLWDKANLQQESVLNFSSSSDDSDSQDGGEEPVPRTPLFRDSLIATSWRDSDVSIGTARIVKTTFNPNEDPTRSAFIPPAHKTSRLSDISTTSTNANNRSSVIPLDSPRSSMLPSFNNRTSVMNEGRFSRLSDMSNSTAQHSTARFSSQVPTRTSSRMLNSLNSRRSNQNLRQNRDPRASILSNTTQDEDRQHSRTPSQVSNSSFRPGLDRQPSTKIMRVTRQEESLLAAMRLKKANMRRTILTEAYHTALEEEEAAALAFDTTYERPKTSGDRDSMGESVLQLDNIGSPTILPRPRTAEGRQSLGPEDFMLLNTPLAPPIQAVPPPPSLTNTTTSSFHRSQSQSQSQSDIASTSYRDSIIPSEKADTVASPSTARTSPITPTATLSLPPSSPDLKFLKNLPHPSVFHQPSTTITQKSSFPSEPPSSDLIDRQPQRSASKPSLVPLSVPPPRLHPSTKPPTQVTPAPRSQPPPPPQGKPPAPPTSQPPSTTKTSTKSKPKRISSAQMKLPGVERSLFAEIDDAAEEAVNLDDFPVWAKGWNSNMQIPSPVSPPVPSAVGGGDVGVGMNAVRAVK